MEYKTLKRLASYPTGSQVQGKSGHVRVKDRDGKWHPRGRVEMARFLKRELLPSERVFHINGKPDEDHPENLVAIKFSGTRYFIARSRPVYIPSKMQDTAAGVEHVVARKGAKR